MKGYGFYVRREYLEGIKNKKALDFSKASSGMDGTRTRDLLRDRQAF